MRDLTQGPIGKHVLALSIPMGAGMILQTLYFFVDLYFVSRLGDAAIAGVSAAGNLMFVVFFLTQMLSVGSVAMVSHAVGRKNQKEANHIFNQSVAIGGLCALATLIGGYLLVGPYMRFFGADEATRSAGSTFLYFFLPNLVLQYALVVMGSGLRATGIVKPTMVVQMLTVLLNVILAPVLIAGWLTGMPLGVAGAGLASSVSVVVGIVVLVVYFLKLEHYISFDVSEWKPDFKTWGRMLNIGLPSGGEFALMSFFVGIFYWAVRDFGAAAQAGIGVGFRINQMFVVPALTLAFAAAPIAGQNFGAKKGERVRETFRVTVLYGAIVMALFTAIMQWKAPAIVGIFTQDPAVIAVASQFLHFLSWNFVPAVVSFTCSSMFQAMGNTWPGLWSSAVRIFTFAVPAIWLAHQPGFSIRQIFILSVATVLLQTTVSYLWLRSEMKRRLAAADSPIEASTELAS